MPTPASRAHSVTIAPALDTATAVGDTIQLAAMITDSGGTVLAGVTPTWTSGDPSVAEVSPAGTVAIRAPGTAVILVRVGSVEARAHIVVAQRAAALQVDDTLLQVPEGDRRPLSARVLDARGNPIVGADVTWSAPDPAVAKVESSDAVGVSPGRTSFIAMAGPMQAPLPVEVVPVAGSITVLGGDGQRGPAGAELPVPVTAQVVSRGGRPIAGVVASFHSAAGAIESALDTSDARGIVKTMWRLGELPGRQQLSVAVQGVSTSPTVSAEADPLPANTRVEIATPDFRGRVGDTLREPVVVRVTDSLGRALADLPVTWSPVEGGAFTAHTIRTDSLGEARATWRLGTKAGRGSGDRQTGSVGQPLPQAIVLRATDLHGNPVAGAVLRLLPAAGRSDDSELSTDSIGRARVVWTLGRTAGLQRLTARLQGDTAATEITAVARPGKAVKLVFVNPPESGKAGRVLPKPLVVQVTDSHGNPIPGQTVLFKANSGSVTPTRGLSDADGRTSVRWTLGPKAQRPELTAKVPGTVVGRTLTVSAKP